MSQESGVPIKQAKNARQPEGSELSETAKRSYQVYVLRVWRDEGAASLDAQPEWRFSLEDPGTGQRRGFPNLEAMTVFLVAQLEGIHPNSQRQTEAGAGGRDD